MPTLRENIDAYLAKAHEHTALGLATMGHDGVAVGSDALARADAMTFLTDMVMALEDCVRILAAGEDHLAAKG